jgi:tetratricopeptide (TPR) repeat protein
MGNLESADSTMDNLEKAMDYFQRAIAIRIEGGDEVASLLANSYLCMSRAYFFKKEYESALNMVAQSEALFVHTIGPDAHFMAQ